MQAAFLLICNIIIHPPAYRATVLLYNFMTGKLYNAQGNEFLLWEDPEILRIAQTCEWNKLIFSRVSWLEIKAGRGSSHGGVYYSLHHIPEVIWKRMENMARWKRGWKFQDRFYAGHRDATLGRCGGSGVGRSLF